MNDTQPVLINVTGSKFRNNLGNIVYINNISNIDVDNDTRSSSDSDLIGKYTLMTVQLSNYTYGENGTIFCNISSIDEIPVDGIVYVIINNVTYSGNINEGIGSINLVDVNAGNYVLTIIYNGTDIMAKAAAHPVNLTVYKIDVDMNVSASNITYGEDVLVNIIFNQTVEGLAYINYSNITYSVNINGDSGIINITGLISGDYTFDIYFESLIYNASIQTVNFTVNKAATSIHAKNAAYIINYGGVYKVVFNPKLAGFKINFKLNGKNIATAKTDASGVAKITLSAKQLKTASAGKRKSL